MISIKRASLPEKDPHKANLVVSFFILCIMYVCIMYVDLPIKDGQRVHEFHERGVAIIASTALN